MGEPHCSEERLLWATFFSCAKALKPHVLGVVSPCMVSMIKVCPVCIHKSRHPAFSPDAKQPCGVGRAAPSWDGSVCTPSMGRLA